jgi:cholesterol 7-desaturase
MGTLPLPPLVDGAVVAGVVAAAVAAAAAGHALVAAALALVAGALAWAVWTPAVWRQPTPGPVGTTTRKIGGELRCPYPDAWYALCLSCELPPGGVKAVNVGGVDLVAWRPRDGGHAVVLDAHCSHLGAHLGVGGTVDADGCIRCPFHGWRFDAGGQLADVPGCASSDPLPPNAALRKWPCVEQNGLVSVWVSSRQHAGAPGVPPLPRPDGPLVAPWYHVPAVPELTPPLPPSATGKAATTAGAAAPAAQQQQPAWVLHGWTEHHVDTVLWDIPENGSDVAHLPALHGAFIVPALARWFAHRWEASWTPRPRGTDGTPPASNGGCAFGPFVDIVIREEIAAAPSTPGGTPGRPVPGTLVAVAILQAGPSQVFLRMSTPVGPIYVVETVTPVAPARQRVLHALYAPWWVPRLLAKVILYATVVQFEKDVPIWCAKRYEPRPVLSKADRGIPTYRRWTQQFFGADSISYEDAVRRHVADAAGLPSDAKKSLEW